ncbi:MFS transporter [Dyadobacter sp. Leaf189]|uniref:MFS transporter n=1 Tax=Dyadobacter sp. Leaf189 TaxID=1736295 RepID=UPI0006F786BE|nr:MFS transporter [Dyadobacter sp. Leaf189]KQS27031.1 Fosmidomycin resistance protein [Dyadobacter sp. Leaf189]
MMTKGTPAGITTGAAQQTAYSVLYSISLAHLLNDMLQAVIPAIYPLIKNSFHLDFAQIGMVTLVFQLTASILQPFVGFYTDKYPKPFSLAVGMGISLLGLVSLSYASSYYWILGSVSLIGMGSSVFHPESSRVAYLASGGKRGLAQSIFQLGGNAGSALGPLLTALIVVPYGQQSVMWFTIPAILAIFILTRIGNWYKSVALPKAAKAIKEVSTGLSRRRVAISMLILLLLIFSKYFYLAGMTSYFTFYLMDKFDLSVKSAQIQLFIFLAAIAVGTFAGGPLGDKFGRKYIIWISILGAAPFTLLLPYANLFWTTILSICTGLLISSAFSAIIVYAQELMPGKVGMIAGLFFGFAFGMGGLGSALLGKLADQTSISYVFDVCSYLPLIGILTYFLPDVEKQRSAA